MTTKPPLVADVVVVLLQPLSVEVVLAVAAASAGHQRVSDTDKSTEKQRPFRPSYATRDATYAGDRRPRSSSEWFAEAPECLAECCWFVLLCEWSVGGAFLCDGGIKLVQATTPRAMQMAQLERGGENGKVEKKERRESNGHSVGSLLKRAKCSRRRQLAVVN